GVPVIRVGDCRYNAEACFTLMREADRQGVRALCLPELCLTGSTCGDLFWQETLLDGAEQALQTVLQATKNLDMITAIGLPLRRGGALYNCAALIHRGEILGVVEKAKLAAAQMRLPPGRGRPGSLPPFSAARPCRSCVWAWYWGRILPWHPLWQNGWRRAAQR
ncbi:MAG: nitrilase-related carbon-nitrogen hydrolase, partial [Pseudoflavonifractor sp.]